MYKFLKTSHPDGIRTRHLLFCRRTRWPLCHAARATSTFLFRYKTYIYGLLPTYYMYTSNETKMKNVWDVWILDSMAACTLSSFGLRFELINRCNATFCPRMKKVCSTFRFSIFEFRNLVISIYSLPSVAPSRLKLGLKWSRTIT
jgi:hypothetical protein